MPEKCILEALGTGVPNGNVTVKHQKVINPQFVGVLHETLKIVLAIKG